MATETEELPSTTSENAAIKSAMSSWMAGLQKDLPNPSLGQSSGRVEEPTTQPEGTGTAKETTETVPPVVLQVDKTEVKPQPEVKTDISALPEDKWPRSAKEWKNFTSAQKTRNAEYEKQIKERDERLKTLEAQVSQNKLPPEVETKLQTLTKENDDYSKQLRLLAVTQHPKFKAYFEGKTNATLAQLKSCVPADQVDSVTRLVLAGDSESRDQQLDNLMETMTTLQRGRFMGVLSGLSAIQGEREGEVARAQQDYEQMTAQAKVEREQKATKFRQALDDTVKSMQDAAKGRPEYQLREGETEWNASVQKRIDAGKALITGNLAPEVMFKAAFDAAAYPDVLAGYKASLAEIEKLKKQVASMTAANPRVEGAKRSTPTSTSNGSEETRLPKDARPMDFTNNWVKKFGDAMRGESA